MEREMVVGATGNSGRDSVMARRKLRPRVVPRATPTAATGGQDGTSIKTGTEEREALISVWWDDPPAGTDGW
jgi:hypothetical protein